MTSLLDKAIRQASALPAEQQDELAQIIMDELAAEAKWDRAFAGSAEQLGRLAADALAEHRRGDTQPLDPGALWNHVQNAVSVCADAAVDSRGRRAAFRS